jgi:pimeloyl-ACP methyl ester carboxylesterase
VTVSATPLRDTTIQLRDGRHLAVAEWGEPDGRPVLLFHGGPGSRLFCPDAEATNEAGVRLICPDRPGYGGSDPRPGRTLLDWDRDVHDLAEAFGLGTFAIVGWSSGGPYAMACAVAMGERVSSIALVASDGPPDEVPGVSDAYPPDTLERLALIRTDPVAAREVYLERFAWYANDPASILRQRGDTPESTNADAVRRRDPVVRAALEAMFVEGGRQGAVGLVDDVLAYQRPWEFSPSEVHCPTSVWWGDEDALLDRIHAEYLALAIDGATLHIEPNEGHGLAMRHWAVILAELLRA